VVLAATPLWASGFWMQSRRTRPERCDDLVRSILDLTQVEISEFEGALAQPTSVRCRMSRRNMVRFALPVEDWIGSNALSAINPIDELIGNPTWGQVCHDIRLVTNAGGSSRGRVGPTQ